jgi:hypothetical protein
VESLKEGSRAIEVRLVQRLLNKRGASPRLKEDGAFGPLTKSALIAFQRDSHLVGDGVAGRLTWSRLGLVHDITHPVRLFPQPTNVTCWSAAATMIVGNMSVGPGDAVLTDGGLAPDPANIRKFADASGWQMHYPQTWAVSGLAGVMRRKPIWVVGGGSSPTGSWLHAFVISALWSDGAEDASGTMIRIHDPWPPGIGSVYGRFYRGTVDGFDFISLFVLQPR